MTDAMDGAEPRNRLAEASSPYLLQHADNPVAWLPWGDDAFRRAEREGRPLFLSIGYSTCHWCHVMAHESFEDEEVAELLNEHFVPVKVDREERPDVDKVYMTACQLMTGQGGWPLTVVTTPEGDPFFAGTYFPKRGRGGRPGLMDVLGRLAQVWEDDREQATEAAGRVRRALERAAAPDAGGDGRVRRARAGDGGGSAGVAVEGEAEPGVGADVADAAYRRLAGRYDEAEGGFGGPPKFPSPHNLVFLFRHADRTGEARAREMAAETLRKMGRGGIRDHVGGGFHRYSTDARWLVPHFEKMLYDQALLTLAHVEGARATGDPRLLATAADTMEYVIRDLRDPSGGFHAAEDADSEGGEGKFYLWTEEELRELLGEDEVRLMKSVYHTRPGGNFAEEATGRKTGENILHRRGSLEEAAEREGMEVDELRERLTAVRERLYEAREGRPRPHRDDKILTDWNGLAIGALARTASALAVSPGGAVRPTVRLGGGPGRGSGVASAGDAAEGGGSDADAGRFLSAAVDAAEFLLSELRNADGRLLHRWREGEAGVKANADDYAFLVWGLLELYDATLRPRWLEAALELQEQMEEYCRDADRGGYFFAPSDGERLVVRQKEFHDGALPSANSIALWNLRRLERLTGRTEWGERADRLERAAASSVERAPTGHAGLLVGVDFRLGTGHEVVLAGPAAALGTRAADADAPDRDRDAGDALREMARIVRSGYRPRTVTLLRPTDDPDAAERVARLAPYTAEMEGVDGRAAAYVCRDFSCDAPTTDPAALAEALGAPGAAP